MAINGIIKPRLEEIFSLIYSQIEASGFHQSIPAGIVLTGGGAMTVNAKEICNKIIPLPLRIANPPKVGGIVDDIINPALIYKDKQFIAQVEKDSDAQLISCCPELLNMVRTLKNRLETIRETDKSGLALDWDIDIAQKLLDKAITK